MDISGGYECNESIIIEFIENHRKLDFLGVFKTNIEGLSIFNPENDSFIEKLKTTGTENLRQIVFSLNAYKSCLSWCFECICKLFHFSLPYLDHSTLHTYCECIEALTNIMKFWKPKRFTKDTEKLNIHMGGLACLYNLTKDEASLLPLHLISIIVECCLDAIESGMKQEQLVKNGLMILCSDFILNSVRFDRYRCLKTVLNVMLDTENEGIIRMSVAICSILASQLTTEQTAKLSNKSDYIAKMIMLVHSKVEPYLQVDYVLKFTLSALWNITDECYQTCKMFILENGLQVFKIALEVG